VATSDAVPVIIGAAIGASGAVLAQITVSIFNGRRESRRLRWEKDRQEREWELRRAERFLDLKRELYSDFIAHADEAVLFIAWTDELGAPPRPEEPDIGKLERIQANIKLIAPRDVSIRVEKAGARLSREVWALNPDYEPRGPDKDKEQFAAANRALAEAERVMRADLRGEEDRAFGARLEQVPPDRPPAHLLPWWRRAIRPAFRRRRASRA
jgi:hypothetical protein